MADPITMARIGLLLGDEQNRKRLGRDWAWRDFVSGGMDQIAWCELFHELNMPCGCFDGG